MVTLLKIGEVVNAKTLELCGLSSDTKPTDKIDGVAIVNGSTFLEIDTKKIYIYSHPDTTWYEM